MKAKSVAVAGVLILIIGVVVLQAAGRLPSLGEWLGNLNPFRARPSVITMGDAIIVDIKQVSELTTTIYTVQQWEERGEKTWTGIYAFNDSWIIMVEKGLVEAGIDLTQLDASDVSVSEDGKSITVTLPPVTILSDPAHILSKNAEDTYVVVNKGVDQESDLRAKAGAKILETACKDGILNDATEDARAAIEEFMKTTRPDVSITVVSAPVPSVEDCIKMGTPGE